MRTLLILCFYLPFTGLAQISFFKVFTNNGYDFGQGVVQLEDSSYMVCGTSSSFVDGPSQAFLLKLDSLGNKVWSYHYGGVESDWGRRVLYQSGVGYYLAGYTNSIGNGAYDAFLVKTDLNGNELWQRAYGGEQWEKINDAALTRDSGTLLVGQTNSTLNGDNDIYLVRTNKMGDTLWTKKLGHAGEDFATSIVRYNDSTFFVGGQLYIADSSATKGFLMQLGDDGMITWWDTIGNNGNCCINDTWIDYPASTVNFAGWQLNTTSNQQNSFFGRHYTWGDPMYSQCEYSSGNGIKINDQLVGYGTQGKVFMFYRYQDESSFQDGLDMSISRVGGDLFFDASFLLMSVNYPLDDVPGEIVATNDGGAIAVGFTSGMGAGGGNVCVIKIGPNELFPIVPIDPIQNPLVELKEIQNELVLTVYPNPTNGKIYFDGPENLDMHFEIYAVTGERCTEGNCFSSDSIDLTTFKSGVYLLNLKDVKTDKMSMIRLIVK